MDMPRFVSALPQSHPVPSGANPHPQSHNAPGAPPHGQHPGPRHSGPEPYAPPEPSAPLPSHPQAHPPRPCFYIPAMPPPPLVHYQWPMPYPCNPFTGFPGTGFPSMGYGMVMPPFLPTPYMEAPGYMFPPTHLPPVDYRRFNHNQVPGPYQNQYQNRRFRPPAHVPREMVNSEVQTEPTLAATSARAGGLYTERSAESGRGSTATSSPGSSSGRPACTEEKNERPSRDRNIKDDFQVDGQGCGRSTGLAGDVSKACLAKTGHSCVRKALEMPKRNKGSVSEDIIAPRVRRSIGNCDGWSVASNDSLVPVCSSSDREEEDVATKRRVPFSTCHEMRERSPEQLVDQLSAGGEDQIPTHDETIAEQETIKEHLTDRRSHKSVEDDDDELDTKEREPLVCHESVSKSRKANESLWSNSVASYNPCRERVPQNGFLDQLNESDKVCNDDIGSLEDSILQRIYSASKTMNQSVWSVESLAPYIPSDEWLMRNGLLQSDGIPEEVADGGKNYPLTNGSLKAKNNRRLSRRFSMSSVESGSLPLSSLVDLYSQNTSPLLSRQRSNMPFITPGHDLASHKILEMKPEKKKRSETLGNPTQGLNMEPSERDEDSLGLPAVSKEMKTSIPSAEGEQDVFVEGIAELKRSAENIEKEKQGIDVEPSEICSATMDNNGIPLTSQQNVEVSITPAIELGLHKREEMSENVENPTRGLHMEPSESEDSPASPAVGPSEMKASIPSAEEREMDVSEKGSSEPVANTSPNQGALTVTEHMMGSLCTPEKSESMFTHNPPKEKSPCVGSSNEQMGQDPVKGFWEQKPIKLEVPDQKMDDVSPSKANMHDRGVQTGRCMVPKKKNDSRRIHKSKVDEDMMIGLVQRNPKKQGQRRNWPQDNCRQRYADWHDEEPYYDYWSGPGKPRGGVNNIQKQR